MTQRDHKLRLRLVYHRPVIGIRRAAVLTRPFRGNAGVGSVHAGNIELLALKDPEVVGGRGGVIVVGADDGNALRALRDRLRRRAARSPTLDDRGCRQAADRKLPRTFQKVATADTDRQRGNYSDGHRNPSAKRLH